MILGAVLVEVVIIIAGVSIVIITTVAIYQAWRKARAAAVAGTCALFTPKVFPDECLGTCPAGSGQVCTATATRSYAIVFRQDSACTCAAPAGPALPPGGVAPVTGSSRTGG